MSVTNSQHQMLKCCAGALLNDARYGARRLETDCGIERIRMERFSCFPHGVGAAGGYKARDVPASVLFNFCPKDRFQPRLARLPGILTSDPVTFKNLHSHFLYRR